MPKLNNSIEPGTRPVFAAIALLLFLVNVRAHASAIIVRNGVETIQNSLNEAVANLRSGDTLRLSGKFVVQPDYGGGEASNQAPLQITGKTNISIMGGGDAEIFGSGPGDFLSIENCRHLRISGVTFHGDRPPANQIPNGLFSMVQLRRTNSFLNFTRCSFIDFGNHGISHLWGPKSSEFVTVSECRFIAGGATNVPGLLFDGAAVSGIGSHWRVVDNDVIDCVRGFEIENSGSNIVESVIFRGNDLRGVLDIGIMLFVTNGDGDKYRDISITGNTFTSFRYGAGRAAAVTLAGGRRVLIANNVIRGMLKHGLELWSDASSYDLNVTGNTISECGTGIILWRRGFPHRQSLIRGNQISFCNRNAILVIDADAVTIQGNRCFNNGQVTSSPAIDLRGDCDNIVIRENQCFDDQTVKTQSHGISLGSGVRDALVLGNIVLDSQAGDSGMHDDASNTRLSGNWFSVNASFGGQGQSATMVYVSRPPIRSLSLLSAGDAQLNVETQTGVRYQLQYKDELTATSWTDSGSSVLATGAVTLFSDSLGTRLRRFYRVVLSAD